MLAIQLNKACFQRYNGYFCDADVPADEVEQRFSQAIATHLNTTLADVDASHIHSHYLCSTIIDNPFGSRAFEWPRIAQQLQSQTSYAPQAFINAYECAGWGYSLRHALRNQKEERLIAITIVDVNLFNLDYWLSNDNWGHSGFGIITLLLTCAPNARDELNIGVAKSTNAVAEFTVQMRNETSKRSGVKLAHPYFPEKVTGLFYKLVPNADFLPDWHSEFGHCFGADPWISIIKQHQENPKPQAYVASSVALNGYWALAEIHTSEQTQVVISEAQ